MHRLVQCLSRCGGTLIAGHCAEIGFGGFVQILIQKSTGNYLRTLRTAVLHDVQVLHFSLRADQQNKFRFGRGMRIGRRFSDGGINFLVIRLGGIKLDARIFKFFLTDLFDSFL